MKQNYSQKWTDVKIIHLQIIFTAFFGGWISLIAYQNNQPILGLSLQLLAMLATFPPYKKICEKIPDYEVKVY